MMEVIFGIPFPNGGLFCIHPSQVDIGNQMQPYKIKFKTKVNLIITAFIFGVGFFMIPTALLSQDIHISWSENTEPDLLGYKLYYGEESRRYRYAIPVGKETEFTLSELPEFPTIFFAVTAYDHNGNESDYSEELAIENSGPFFILMSNYPNPFNPVTRIPFRLMRSSHVELAIFDVTGRKVKTLMDGPQDAGMHEASWEGDDDSARAVANGVYFCRLLIGDFCITRKLIMTQ